MHLTKLMITCTRLVRGIDLILTVIISFSSEIVLDLGRYALFEIIILENILETEEGGGEIKRLWIKSLD